MYFPRGCKSLVRGTTNSGTDEQERHTRPWDEDKQAHLCDVRTLKSSHGRCRSDWRKGRAFTGGGLTIHVLDNGRGQLQVIVATANEPPSDRQRPKPEVLRIGVFLFLRDKLKLTINREKSGIRRPVNFTILGFGFVPSFVKGEKGRYRIWHHWKKPEKKRCSLIRLGVEPGKAYAYSRSRMGGWAIAQSPILGTTITVKRLMKRGYIPMFDIYKRISPQLNEPLYTRTVRTVVGEAHPVS